jgi:hypothetical protein
VTIEDLIAEGDRVAYRFTLRGTHTGPFLAVAATGPQVTATGIGIGRLADGKLVERWVSLGVLGLLRQLGTTADEALPPETTPRRSPNGRHSSGRRNDRHPDPCGPRRRSSRIRPLSALGRDGDPKAQFARPLRVGRLVP